MPLTVADNTRANMGRFLARTWGGEKLASYALRRRDLQVFADLAGGKLQYFSMTRNG